MKRSQEKYLLSYMPHVDGLRTIAVLAVLIFHFFPKQLPGGFVGVDIFFVISGYLVSGVILKSICEGTFSYRHFYEKRIKRLLPAYLTVVLASLIFAVYFLIAGEFKSFGQQLMSGSFFYSNMFFYSEAGYFDTSAELKPLLHLWSLSLEEQFYLFWPTVLLLCYHFRHFLKGSFLKVSLFLLCGLSFIANIYFTETKPSFAFFFILTRIWELGAGALLFILTNDQKKLKTKINLSFIGLALLLISFFYFSAKTEFPGYAALLPVLGTIFIIYSGETSSLNRLFTNKVSIYIGKISYPLYLWHWPLFSFVYILNGRYISWYFRLLFLGCSFILAAVTYELIEKKLQKSSFRFLTTSLVCGNLILGVVGHIINNNRGFPKRFPEYFQQEETKKLYLFSVFLKERAKICHQFENNEFEMCSLYFPDKDPTVALIGDSHSNHIYPGFSEYYAQKSENLLLLAKSGTPPLYHVRSKRVPETHLDMVFDYIFKSKTIHTVILSAFWANYFEEKGVYLSGNYYKNTIYHQDLKTQNQAEIFKYSLNETIRLLKAKDKKIIFFYDGPSLDFHLSSCLIGRFRNNSCSYLAETEHKKQAGYRAAVFPIINQNQLSSFDPLKVLCSKKECLVTINNNFIFASSQHLSIWGSRYIVKDYDL